MTAHDLTLEDKSVAAELGAALDYLFDAQARRRIVDAFNAGKITGGHAMELLVELQLIEGAE